MQSCEYKNYYYGFVFAKQDLHEKKENFLALSVSKSCWEQLKP